MMLIEIGVRWLCWAIVVVLISRIVPILMGALGGQMGAVIVLRVIRVCWVGIERIGCIIVLRVGVLLSWGGKPCFKNLGPRGGKY